MLMPSPSAFVRQVTEWDVHTWQRALSYWERYIGSHAPAMLCGLELGARHGGLSCFFAKQYGSSMYCSDFGFPSDKAKHLHQEQGVAHLISYHDVDAARIPFEDHSFDFVVFKSVLGAVGARGHYARIEQAMTEIQRVLKPGGVLFFAENLSGSLLHRLARRFFVSWGRAWHYVSHREMQALLSGFSHHELYATGFFAAFIPGPARLKNAAARIDALLSFLPASWKYVGYGLAVKE